jgi:hypothetical protein
VWSFRALMELNMTIMRITKISKSVNFWKKIHKMIRKIKFRRMIFKKFKILQKKYKRMKILKKLTKIILKIFSKMNKNPHYHKY